MRYKQGTITGNKNNKTLVVTVHTYKNHPKYKKRFRMSRKYHVHNPENAKYEIGQEITFYETRPISRLKKWTIVKPEQAESSVTTQS